MLRLGKAMGAYRITMEGQAGTLSEAFTGDKAMAYNIAHGLIALFPYYKVEVEHTRTGKIREVKNNEFGSLVVMERYRGAKV